MEQSGSEEVSIPSSLDENEANDGSSAPAVEDFEEKRQEYEKIEAKWGHDLQLDPSDSNLRSVRTAAVIPFPLFLFFSFFFFFGIYSSIRMCRPTATGCYSALFIFRALQSTIYTTTRLHFQQKKK